MKEALGGMVRDSREACVCIGVDERTARISFIVC